MVKTFSNQQKQQICKLYLSGQNSQQIANGKKVHKTTILRILRKNKIKIRSAKENSTKYLIDEKIFDNITPLSAYWIGFLLADGCVSPRKDGADRIQLSLALEDKEHISKFKLFLKAQHPIDISHKFNYCRISFPSQHIVDVLSKYHIKPRKSGREKVAKSFQKNSHFWRGIIDGDGCITKLNTPYPMISLCGSESVCKSFVRFCKSHVKTNFRAYKIKGYNCWQCSLRGKSQSVKIIKILYQNCPIALDRKNELAKSVMKNSNFELSE